MNANPQQPRHDSPPRHCTHHAAYPRLPVAHLPSVCDITAHSTMAQPQRPFSDAKQQVVDKVPARIKQIQFGILCVSIRPFAAT